MANIVDPVWAFKTTSSLLVPHPTTSSVSSVAPIPTVTPNLPIYEKVGDAGVKTLWVVFVLMLLSTLAFIVLAWRVPVQKRLFHVITALITTFATLSYYAMATGDGSSFNHIVVKETKQHLVQHVYRQVFWARYVDWSLTTPLLLLDLAFLAGLSGADIFVAIVADVIMVLTGLFAAFATKESVTWGWYAMACIAYLAIVYVLAMNGRRTVAAKSSSTAKLFASIGGFTLVLWTLYPIVWGISDGARKWSVDAEIIAYAILDVLAKPVFGFWLLFAHGKNASSIEGFWAHGLTGEGNVRLEDDEA
ncbi:Opsin-1 [Hyphodiscus hymeniophilus]|uniref:Opsin-1 n=1 Tax=Hyphodiscus hymeniophilus TaxID=353542 RepID=A0A9P7AUA8_9HELO|nr:Opsin-1 [Hyphodiscus hymeniophilus]